MARVKIEMPDGYIKKIKTLGDKMNEVTEKTLRAGAEAAFPIIKRSLEDAVTTDRSTGELVDALGISPVIINSRGNSDIKIGFDEPRDGISNGIVTNAMLANVLEYGKAGQPGKGFMKKSVSKAIKAAISAMEDVFEKEIDKL